jgi:hypothetical protein
LTEAIARARAVARQSLIYLRLAVLPVAPPVTGVAGKLFVKKPKSQNAGTKNIVAAGGRRRLGAARHGGRGQLAARCLLKAIGYTEEAQPLFDKAAIKPDAKLGVVALGNGRGLDAFIAAAKKHKVWDREKLVNPPR